MEWKWLQTLLAWFPGSRRRDDFSTANEAISKAVNQAMSGQQAIIDSLMADLRGVRETVHEQDEYLRELRRDNQQLHQQHINCERQQQELKGRLDQAEARVAELESGVRRLSNDQKDS